MTSSSEEPATLKRGKPGACPDNPTNREGKQIVRLTGTFSPRTERLRVKKEDNDVKEKNMLRTFFNARKYRIVNGLVLTALVALATNLIGLTGLVSNNA